MQEDALIAALRLQTHRLVCGQRAIPKYDSVAMRDVVEILSLFFIEVGAEAVALLDPAGAVCV